jgi:hypothetical protein
MLKIKRWLKCFSGKFEQSTPFISKSQFIKSVASSTNFIVYNFSAPSKFKLHLNAKLPLPILSSGKNMIPQIIFNSLSAIIAAV